MQDRTENSIKELKSDSSYMTISNENFCYECGQHIKIPCDLENNDQTTALGKTEGEEDLRKSDSSLTIVAYPQEPFPHGDMYNSKSVFTVSQRLSCNEIEIDSIESIECAFLSNKKEDIIPDETKTVKYESKVDKRKPLLLRDSEYVESNDLSIVVLPQNPQEEPQPRPKSGRISKNIRQAGGTFLKRISNAFHSRPSKQ